jgi:hypothetical protein
MVDWAGGLGIKAFLTMIGGFLLMVGGSIEPSIGVWVVSVGGSLLTSSLGKDRSFTQIVLHIIIGLCWGIFGSQIAHGIFPSIPQVASSFFMSLFGVEATWYFFRSFKEGSISKMIVEIASNIGSSIASPWKGKETEK